MSILRIAPPVTSPGPPAPLRGIKQLGTANLVYPGAVHTRFDRSLGVSALAHLFDGALGDGVARLGLRAPLAALLCLRPDAAASG